MTADALVSDRPASSRRPALVVAAATAALVLPLVIALAVLAGRRWHPVLDLAMTELRVRDVGTRHTPLIGLPGRIGVAPIHGSHPGPLSFYLVAPFYRIADSSSWGLLLGAVAVHAAAVATAIWLGWRRWRWGGVAVVGALVALMLRAYGQLVLIQPWNPYLPLIAWIVVLLAIWAVVGGDHTPLVAGVAAGSLCAQTHVPYLLLCVGMIALGFAVTLWRRAWRPAAIAGIVGFVLWLPPLVDQLVHRPGNLRILIDHFTSPPEDPIGVGAGLRLALRNLDVATLLGGDVAGPGGFVSQASAWRGGVFLAVWVAAAAWAWRSGTTALRSLHVTVGTALGLGTFSMIRIFGTPWYYLTLWAWTTTALALGAVVWTLLQAVRRPADTALAGAELAGAPVDATGLTWRLGALVAALLTVVNLVTFARAHNPEERLSDAVGALAGPTWDAVARGDGAADGTDSRYIVRWTDAADIGSPGYGLFDELERRGLDVIADEFFAVPMTGHRVGPRSSAVAQIHLATGGNVEIWRAVPDAVEVARYDPRSDEERAVAAARRDDVIARLTAEGLDDLVPLVDTNLFGLALDPRLSRADQVDVTLLLDLGQPMSVFIAPPPADGDPNAL